MRLRLIFGNSFTISVLVGGVDSGNGKICCWREGGFRGQGLCNFELAGNLKCLCVSGSLLLFKLLLLPPFKLFRSPSGSAGLLGFLILTFSGSGCISIVIVIVVVVVIAVVVVVAVVAVAAVVVIIIISSSSSIIIIIIITIIAASRFALRVSLFARSPQRGDCIFSAVRFCRFHSSSMIPFNVCIWK